MICQEANEERIASPYRSVVSQEELLEVLDTHRSDLDSLSFFTANTSDYTFFVDVAPFGSLYPTDGPNDCVFLWWKMARLHGKITIDLDSGKSYIDAANSVTFLHLPAFETGNQPKGDMLPLRE